MVEVEVLAVAAHLPSEEVEARPSREVDQAVCVWYCHREVEDQVDLEVDQEAHQDVAVEDHLPLEAD